MSIKKILIIVATVTLLTPIFPIFSETVLASDEKSTIESNITYEIIDDTTVWDNHSQSLYTFDSNEDMNLYLKSPSPFNYADDDSMFSTLSTGWTVMNFNWYTKMEVARMRPQLEKAVDLADFTMVASGFLWKIPGAGPTVGLLAYFFRSQKIPIINAAKNNQSMTVYHEKVNNWNGYGPRTRLRRVFFN